MEIKLKKCPRCGFELKLIPLARSGRRKSASGKEKTKRKIGTLYFIRALGADEVCEYEKGQYETMKNCPHCDIPLKEENA